MANLVPVLVFSAAVMALALFPNTFASQFGGTFSLSFKSGVDSPITSLVFHFPPEVSNAIVIDSATNAFKTELRGTDLTLSGGSLPRGDTLTVTGHIVRYIPP